MTSNHHVYLTPAGLRRLDARIAAAREAYLAVCQSNEEAAGAGDSSVWHDNFAYEENQRRMHQLAARVRDLEALARRVRLAQPAATGAERARVGVSVRVVNTDDAHEAVWFLAGYDDGDVAGGRLSYASPLGAALVGAEAGDVVTVRFDGAERAVEVLEILPAPEEELS